MIVKAVRGHSNDANHDHRLSLEPEGLMQPTESVLIAESAYQSVSTSSQFGAH
jgi:hypothetical protein